MNSKEKILSAVVKIFISDGIEGLTMKKIAVEAGIGKSTVYEYFDSKETLLAESIIFTANKFIESFYDNEWNQPDVKFEQQTKASIEHLILSFKSELGQFITFIQESHPGGQTESLQSAFKQEMMKLHVKAFAYTTELVVKGQHEGILRADLLKLDIVNFERIFMILCAGFSDQVPMISKLSDEVENKVDYVYDNLIRMFGK